jgi:hypothetical protein
VCSRLEERQLVAGGDHSGRSLGAALWHGIQVAFEEVRGHERAGQGCCIFLCLLQCASSACSTLLSSCLLPCPAHQCAGARVWRWHAARVVPPAGCRARKPTHRQAHRLGLPAWLPAALLAAFTPTMLVI